MRTNAHIRRGLTRAGFTGGWLDDPRDERWDDRVEQAIAPDAD
jgi:hypothetical protein